MKKRKSAAAPRSRAARNPGERIFPEISRLLAEHEFDSLAEVNAFLQARLDGGGLLLPEPTTPQERAYVLIDEALDATSRKRRVELAREALALSPDCVDAYILLAEDAETPKEARALLAEGVQVGERALGDELKELVAEGAVWLATETRPYMRARAAFAESCWAMGDRQAAIQEMWELLRLNQNDNQGNRYVLLSWLLAAGSLEQIERLLPLYPDESSAAWLYDRALHAFRINGGHPEATSELRAALRVNKFVPDFLLGRRVFPADEPEYIGWGDESEAVVYAGDALSRWLETPGALTWLDSKAKPSRRGKAK